MALPAHERPRREQQSVAAVEAADVAGVRYTDSFCGPMPLAAATCAIAGVHVLEVCVTAGHATRRAPQLPFALLPHLRLP